jgi:asparagine N-glycosylation enzyme membrane subunit Stt3
MIKEVFFRMSVFMIIYIIGHFAFAETFFFISKSSKSGNTFITSYSDAFTFSFLLALGEFVYEPWDESDNPHLLLVWVVLLLCMVFNMIVMLNLLISLISFEYEIITNLSNEYRFKERAIQIANVQSMLP